MVKTLLTVFFLISFASCNAQIGPGYRFNLFDKTPNESLSGAVAKENVKEIKRIIAEHKANIDLQEPQFGNTVLMLAVGNSKLLSIKALLEAGADVNIRDYSDNAPIYEASQLYLHKKHAYEILELLIKYGADVNVVHHGTGIDSTHYNVPLSNVVSDFRCAKLLVDNGANPSFTKNGLSYPVWISMLNDFDRDNIFVARYIIVEKRIPVPPIILNGPNGKKLTILDFLNDTNFPKDSNKRKARADILNFLNYGN